MQVNPGMIPQIVRRTLASRTIAVSIFGLLALIAIFSLSSMLSQAAPISSAPLKIGFITVGPINDMGYNFAHNQGRLYMESVLGKQVKTSLIEKIPESAEVERVMEKLIAQGNKLIFSTSYGYLEPALRVAKRHPNVIIMQTGRTNYTNNLGTYFAYMYQPQYVAGMVAGKVTKKNKIGFVCAHPIPVILQGINAFTLGARSVNPKVKVNVVWTNSWSDPPTEAEAAKGLIDAGVDVLVMILDNPTTVIQTAESHGIYCVGTQVDLQKLAPRGWLTGSIWNWGPLYVKVAQSVRDGIWKTGTKWYGMKESMVKVASFGPAVPETVRAQAQELIKAIEQDKFTVLAGPIKDRNGKIRLAVGQKPNAQWLANMDFFVEGVEGTLPKK